MGESRGEVHVGFQWGNLHERNHLKNGRVILKFMLNNGIGVWSRLMWLRMGGQWQVVVNMVMNLKAS